MKVIVAGLSKTGTKSMQAALQELGFDVYDFMENYLFLKDDWTKICRQGGSTEDFKRMFENVDAVSDIPACYFWDEILKAFPQAKVILTIRENEDEWFHSFKKQILKNTNFYSLIGIYISPSLAQFSKYGNLVGNAVFGSSLYFPWFRPLTPIVNKSLLCMIYRRHNSHVLHTAPKDNLLVFNVKDGWEPLCRFLEVDVPNKPFPHRNVNGQIVDEYLETLPFFQSVKKELFFSMSLLSVILGFGIYKFVKSQQF